MQSDRYKQYRGKKHSRKAPLAELKDSVVVANGGAKFTLLPGKVRDGRDGTLLGQGSSGKVKKAQDEKENTLVVKTPLVRASRKQADQLTLFDHAVETTRVDQISKLEREYRFLKRSGDHLARFVVTDRNAYLFQAQIKGRPLCHHGEGCLVDLVKESNGDEKNLPVLLIKMAGMIFKVIAMIEHIHAKRILHCDLNQANIIFDFDSVEGGIVDFGEAIFFEEYVGQKKAELHDLIPHRTLEHLQLNEYEEFFWYLERNQHVFNLFAHYLNPLLELLKMLQVEFKNSREEVTGARLPSEMVGYAKEELIHFITRISQEHGIKVPETLFQTQVHAKFEEVALVAESKSVDDTYLQSAPPEHENTTMTVAHAKSVKNYIQDGCRASSKFFKEKWQSVCELFSCCTSSVTVRPARVSNDEIIFTELDKEVVCSGSTYTGPLQQFCGPKVQPASNDTVIVSTRVTQAGHTVCANIAEMEHHSLLRKTNSIR